MKLKHRLFIFAVQFMFIVIGDLIFSWLWDTSHVVAETVLLVTGSIVTSFDYEMRKEI